MLRLSRINAFSEMKKFNGGRFSLRYRFPLDVIKDLRIKWNKKKLVPWRWKGCHSLKIYTKPNLQPLMKRNKIKELLNTIMVISNYFVYMNYDIIPPNRSDWLLLYSRGITCLVFSWLCEEAVSVSIKMAARSVPWAHGGKAIAI